jgi:hypothetical protein
MIIPDISISVSGRYNEQDMKNGITNARGVVQMFGKNSSGLFGGLFFLGLFLAVAAVLSAFIFSATVKEIRMSNQTVRVKGYAEKRIESDMAVWNGSFISRNSNLEEAYSKLQSDLEKIMKYLEGYGISRKMIDVSSVNTMVRYRRNSQGMFTNDIERYDLEQRIGIRSSDIGMISRISKESTSLIREGIEFISYPPKYYFTGMDAMKIELLGEATRDAFERARQLAENSGSRVGGLASASQGVFQITPLFSTEVQDYGMYDTSTIEKSMKAVVTVEYSIIK